MVFVFSVFCILGPLLQIFFLSCSPRLFVLIAITDLDRRLNCSLNYLTSREDEIVEG